MIPSSELDAPKAPAGPLATLETFLHELSLPLSMVQGFADMLRDSGLPPHHDAALQGIAEHTAYLQELMRDFAELARLQNGAQGVQRVPLDVAALIAEALAEEEPLCRQAGLALEVRWSSFLPEIVAIDPVALRRIVHAAVLHVMRRSHSGPVQMTISYRDRGDGRADSGLCLRIGAADAGPVHRDLLPFSVRDAQGRPELGLSVAKGWIQLLGGDLQVSGDGDRGLWLAIQVPAPAMAGATWIDPLRVKLQRRRELLELPPGCRILVVEDTPDLQLLVRHVLQKAGAVVDVVDRGDLAVQRVLASQQEHSGYDAVLTDLMMPVLDGQEAVRIMRKHGYRGAIVAMTSRTLPEDEQMCREAGCDAFLRKPVRRDSLVRTLARVIRNLPSSTG